MLTAGTPKVVTAQRFLGVTGVYWGRSLRSLTGVRERECKMQNAECKMQNAKCKMQNRRCGARAEGKLVCAMPSREEEKPAIAGLMQKNINYPY